MKVQNWKRRRSLASLLAVPLMASSLVSMPAFAGSSSSSSSSSRSSGSSSTSSSSRSSSTSSTSSSSRSTSSGYGSSSGSSSTAKPSGGYGSSYYGSSTTSSSSSKPAPAPAPSKSPDYSGGSSSYYRKSEPAPAPAQKTPDYSGGSRDAYKRADTPAQAPAQQPQRTTTPPATSSGSIFGFGRSAPAPAPAQAPAQKRNDTPAPAPAPAQKQVFKYDIKPAPVAPAQKSVIPVPVSGFPQPTTKAAAPTVTYNGAAYQTSKQDAQGKVVVKNEMTGKATAYDKKTGAGTTSNKTGTVKNDFKVSNDGYKYNSITFKGATGETRTKQYKTMPTSIATASGTERVVTKYVPRDSLREREIIYRDTSSMDYLLMYMLINQANQNRNNGGGYVGGGGGGSYDSSGGYSGGGVTIPAPPRVATGFEVNWDKKFDLVPSGFQGAMTYTNPAEAVAAYVTLDIINDNSDVPGGWGKFLHTITFGAYDNTKNLKKFELDKSARSPLTQQVTMMAADMLKNSEVDLSAVIDEKTGELKKDAAGTPVNYNFVVDPSNANQVKDAETQASCNLAVASILRPVEAVVSGDIRFMKMKVIGGGHKEGECKAKQLVMVDQGDLEEMNNDLAAKIDEAIHALPKMSKPVFN